MSAAEKLKALDLEPFSFVENKSGCGAVAIDLGKWRIFQHALPQIVATVEAAETLVGNQRHPRVSVSNVSPGSSERVRAALAALDEALT